MPADRYFCHDYEDGWQLHETLNAARADAEARIADWRDVAHREDGWPDDVEEIRVGVVLESAQKVDPDIDHRLVDYHLAPVAIATAEDGATVTPRLVTLAEGETLAAIIRTPGLKRGDVLLDEHGEEDWLVAYVTPAVVRCLDLASWTAWEWHMCDDGIRVERAREIRPEWDTQHEAPATEWITEAVTLYPPPPAVAEHLRAARSRKEAPDAH